MVRLGEGDALAGRSLGEQAVALARGTADAFSLTLALASSGVVLLALERYDEARLALEESVARGRRPATPGLWRCRCEIWRSSRIAGRTTTPPGRFSRRACGGSGRWARNRFLSRSMETLAEVMAAAGDSERAARLFGAAETLRDPPSAHRSSPSTAPTTNARLVWRGPPSGSQGSNRAGPQGAPLARRRGGLRAGRVHRRAPLIRRIPGDRGTNSGPSEAWPSSGGGLRHFRGISRIVSPRSAGPRLAEPIQVLHPVRDTSGGRVTWRDPAHASRLRSHWH